MLPKLDNDNDLAGFIQEVRKTVTLSVGLEGAPMAEFTEQLSAFNRLLEQRYTQPKPYIAQSPADAVKAIFNDTPAGGRYNPLACPGELTFADGVVTRRLNLPHPYHGPGKLVHGGVISMLYDDLFAITACLNEIRAQTVSMTVSYKGPTFIQSDLEFTAKIAEREGRKITVHGECCYDGKLLTEASALFIEVKQ
ncbi:MAG: PaaI family thioesterase [Pseudomonadales bacterium]